MPPKARSYASERKDFTLGQPDSKLCCILFICFQSSRNNRGLKWRLQRKQKRLLYEDSLQSVRNIRLYTPYYNLCEDKISENILFACYNDKPAAMQISVEIGVVLPYMEDALEKLCKEDLLKKKEKKYTGIIFFTREFSCETEQKTSDLKNQIADILVDSIKKTDKKCAASVLCANR